jgi:hypothetical protein
MLLDFDEQKMMNEDDRRKLRKLRDGVRNNYPEALPDEGRAQPIYRYGQVYASRPLAIEVEATPAAKEAFLFMAEKLTHALYLKETGRIMTPEHMLSAAIYQSQRVGMETFTSYFTNLLPDWTVGLRPNIEEYGDRFKYLSGYKPNEDFFVYASQFGRGLILSGVVWLRSMNVPDGPFTAQAKQGGCGPGAAQVLASVIAETQ